MTDLSDKFGKLMARMAQTDAELFRTIGEHNRSVTEQVMDLTQEEAPSDVPALLPPPLLPVEERSESALRKRFKSCKATFQWIEEQLGPPPSKKKSWSIAIRAITSGQWEVAAITPKRPTTTTAVKEQLERVNQRLDRMEGMLQMILQALHQLPPANK